jgi:quercetin dioxygenase-like cupin family protein
MKIIQRGGLVLALALLPVAVALAQGGTPPAGGESPTMAIMPAAKVAFQPLAIPGFDPGVKLAVISGNPNAESGDYVLRLSFPARYKFPAHFHPMAENLTVLSGELMVGMGTKPDQKKLTGYKAGSFLYIPGKMPHFGGARGPTIVQLHGRAPFKIELAQ